MRYQQVAVLCTVLVLTVSLGDSFRLFGGGGGGGEISEPSSNGTSSNGTSSNGTSSNSTSSNSTSPDATSPMRPLGKTLRLLVRKVDQPDPYYRSMNFFVPAELNYMLGEYLLKEFSAMLSKHCNVTNVTMLVRNDLELLESDYDVWKMRDGDRIEIWAKKSGPPTRTDTAKAFAKKYSGGSGQPGGRPGGRPPRRCPMGRRCPKADEGGVSMPDDSAKVEVAAGGEDDEAAGRGVEPGPGDEPIVVPDWSEMP